MKKSGASQGQSASELISKRIAELVRQAVAPQQFWQVEPFVESEVLGQVANSSP